ncbi:hypothetical protein [Streptomyces roseoviridis]|uniref:SCP2 domain-containing protein n=1 Tax=Streptomyces roseoviridis TaxID=67361 RepID=A0ABV5QLN6_9ACTN
MTHEEFTVPDLQNFAEAIGAEPTETQEGIYEIDLTEVGSEPIRFSFSPAGRSVRMVWKVGDDVRVDIYREGATRLWIDEANGETSLCTEFSMGSVRGVLRLRVFPSAALRDELLFH